MDIKVRCSVCGGVGEGSGIPPEVTTCQSCSGTGLATIVWDVAEFTALAADVTTILKRTEMILKYLKIEETSWTPQPLTGPS